MVAEGIIVSALVVLTGSEREKLENKDLEEVITRIAKDLHVDWAVEVSGNVAVATISKQFGPVVGSTQEHEVELLATNFMTGISELELPKDKKAMDIGPSKLEKELSFCKEVLENFDETEEEWGIIGAELLCGPKNHPIRLSAGRISSSLLRKMFESFIKVHSNDD